MARSLVVRAVAAVSVLSQRAAGARTLVGIHTALEAKAGAQAADDYAARRSGPPDLRTVVETILQDPPNVMDPNATQDVLNYCLESGFKCDKAIEWRRQCYDVMGDPITRGPKAEGKKRKGRKPDLICEEDPVYLDVEGELQAACKKAFVCVDMPSRTYVAGHDGKKVGHSNQHCAGMPGVTMYKACVPDWQPDGQDALRNPADVVSALPAVKLPPKVEEVISEFVPFFGSDWFPAPAPAPGGEVAAPETTTTVAPAVEETVDRSVEARVQEARCICNDDATRAVLLETQDRLTGKSLFVGSSGLMTGHAPKITLESASPCACLQKFYDRRPWSWFAATNQCTDAPTFWDPVTESTQIWLREKARRPFSDVEWFDDCHALCQDPRALPRVDTACELADA